MVTTADPAPVRLRIPPLRRWGPGARWATFGAIGFVVGVLGGIEAIGGSQSVTGTGRILFGVVGVVCILLGLWLVRTGVNVVRHRTGRLPAMTATGDTVRLERPGRKDRTVARTHLDAATFEVRPRQRGEAPLAYLQWLDADRRSLGTWTVDPIIGWGLPSFLRDIGVELVATPAPDEEPAGEG